MKPFFKEILGGRKKKIKTPEQAPDQVMDPKRPSRPQFEELGTIDYVNLTPHGRHGDYNAAVQASLETGKPIFANFVEWSGWRGCKDAGAIFADPIIKRAAEELFVPCAFNTWDRDDRFRNQAFKEWGSGLAKSWWGYLRIVDASSSNSGGKKAKSLVVTGTKQITGRRQLDEVKRVMVEALEDLGHDVPDYLS